MALLAVNCVTEVLSHVVDPKNPGVVDEIIHLGDYWNETGMLDGRQDVIKINTEVGKRFQRAYKYLGAAACIIEDTAVLNASHIDRAKENRVVEKLVDGVFGGIPLADKVGRERKMFASAITPDGLKNYLDDLIVQENVHILEGFPGSGTDRLLERLKQESLARGLYTEAYYCAFHPRKLEHLIIPALDTAFSTVGKYHSTDACACEHVDFREMLDELALGDAREELEFDGLEFDRLLERAIRTIGGAKALHDEMEKYYIPHMDFDSVKKRWEATMERILRYSAEK